MSEEPYPETKHSESRFHLWHVILGAIIVWVVTCVGIIYYFGRPSSAGEFGDLFGAVNALFSGLAFACVIYAIFLQRSELELQREELKLTRKELTKTSDTGLRMFHFELMRMSMADPELHEVWNFHELRTPKEAKQHTYVSVILNYWSLLFGNRLITEDQFRPVAESYMKAPVFRAFWSRNRDYRRQIAEAGSDDDRSFHTIFDRAYETVAASDGTGHV